MDTAVVARHPSPSSYIGQLSIQAVNGLTSFASMPWPPMSTALAARHEERLTSHLSFSPSYHTSVVPGSGCIAPIHLWEVDVAAARHPSPSSYTSQPSIPAANGPVPSSTFTPHPLPSAISGLGRAARVCLRELATAIVVRHPPPSNCIGQPPSQAVSGPISSISVLQPPTSTVHSRSLAVRTWIHYASSPTRYPKPPLPTNSSLFSKTAYHQALQLVGVLHAWIPLSPYTRQPNISSTRLPIHPAPLPSLTNSVSSVTPPSYDNDGTKRAQGIQVYGSEGLERPGPYPAHYTLPAPSSSPFAHPKPSTSNIPTAIPSFGPGAPPSPPSTTSSISLGKSSRRWSVDSYSTPTDVPQLPTPPSSHSNVPFPANSMSLVTLPEDNLSHESNVSCYRADAFTGDILSPLCQCVRA